MDLGNQKSRHHVSNGNHCNGQRLNHRSKAQPLLKEEIHTPKSSLHSGIFHHFVLLNLLTMKSCLVFLIAIVVVSLVGLKARSQSSPHACMSSAFRYAIIFDAGSTGSRIHIFTFANKSAPDGSGLTLENEYFEEVKPGLSSYADNPRKAALSLANLTHLAMEKIPQESWSETPILLKATAGLRLLTEPKRNAILREVERLFRQLPFQVQNGYVSMLSGEDEGICAWITINFLLDRIQSRDSVIVLDLGGASTQVTFSPQCPETYSDSPSGYLVDRRFLKNDHLTLYAHSYLGLGLMATRHSILQVTSHSPKRLMNGTIIMESPCIQEGVETIWKYSLDEYLIRTSTKNGFNHEECKKIISDYIKDFHVHQPCEMELKNIVAISYYYDRAVDMGLIDDEMHSGVVLIEDFKKASDAVCRSQDKSQPFLCLDSSYILALWTEGLGLHPDQSIMLSKKMKGVETSWGLGAGYQAIYGNL